MELVKRSLAIVVGTTFLASGAVVGQRRYVPNSPDSFIRFQVESTDELVKVLEGDPVLRRRFARHFGVSEAEIVDFVKRALIPYRLPNSRSVTVYGVNHRTGRVYAVRSHLRRGTRVWATRSGVPVLKWLCANPFTKTLPGVTLAGPPTTAKSRGFRGGRVAALPPTFIELPPALPGEISPLQPGVPLVTPLSGGGIAALPAIPGVSLPFIPFTLPTSLLAFAFVPILHGGSGGGVTPSADVPEPATLALAAAALPALALGLRRRRRGLAA